MKKQISAVLLSIMVMCSFFVLPISANTVIDYSCYNGIWYWDEGGSELHINYCTNTEMSFNFQIGQFAINIPNAKVDGTTVYAEYYEDWRDAESAPAIVSGSFTLTLSDSGIWVDWNDVQDFDIYVAASNHGMMFHKPNFNFRTYKIESENYSVVLNGKQLEFDQPPIMVNDRILVPLRKIFEELNAEVYYHEVNNYGGIGKEACIDIITNGTDRLRLYGRDEEGEYKWRLDGGELDVCPMVINGRTLVPVRILMETLGGDVSWDDGAKAVNISCAPFKAYRSKEEIEKIQAFNCDDALETAKKEYASQPEYTVINVDHRDSYELNEKGKCYGIFVLDADNHVHSYLEVYHDGTIVRDVDYD